MIVIESCWSFVLLIWVLVFVGNIFVVCFGWFLKFGLLWKCGVWKVGVKWVVGVNLFVFLGIGVV